MQNFEPQRSLDFAFIIIEPFHISKPGREDFNLSIGGLNSNIPYTGQELLKILQSVWSWQSRDFNMALNAEARATEQTMISLLHYMNYEPKLN